MDRCESGGRCRCVLGLRREVQMNQSPVQDRRSDLISIGVQSLRAGSAEHDHFSGK